MLDDEPAALNGKYLGTITKDFVTISDTLKDASYQIRVRKISDFPIFIICKAEQVIGQLLIARGEQSIGWNYYVAYIDEFIQRGLIGEDKAEEFMQAYKDPEEYCCIFVIDMEFTNFVFIPYPED